MVVVADDEKFIRQEFIVRVFSIVQYMPIVDYSRKLNNSLK